MPLSEYESLDSLRGLLGKELAVSDWLAIDQDRVNGFAEVTGDHQWIHVDDERAKRESPFGGTIAHGYLTLSLLAKFASDSIRIHGVRMGLNYGLNRVRFTSPVRVGSRVRARFELKDWAEIQGGAQLTWTATVDIEGRDKPACIAEMLSRWYL